MTKRENNDVSEPSETTGGKEDTTQQVPQSLEAWEHKRRKT